MAAVAGITEGRGLRRRGADRSDINLLLSPEAGWYGFALTHRTASRPFWRVLSIIL